MFYIYKITNKINNKSYIGYTKSLEKRLKAHKYSYGNHCPVFYKAIKKYGWNNFETTILFESKEDILHLEPVYISLHNTLTPNGYNAHPGGSRGNSEILSKKLNGKTGKLCPLYGRKHSSLTIERMRLAKRNPWSSESRLKFSRIRTGDGNPMFGKTHSEEERKRISERTSGANNPMFGVVGSADHLNKREYTCEFCNITTNLGNYKRWHSQKCKQKPG